MNKELTQKQKTVLKSVKEYIMKVGKSPTFTELRLLLSKSGLILKSNNSLAQYLKVLEEQGYIEKTSDKRGIKLLETLETTFCEVPLLGNANCGEALSYADGIIEQYIQISRK